MSRARPRRIVAIVLPDLLCELGRAQQRLNARLRSPAAPTGTDDPSLGRPLAVVMTEAGAEEPGADAPSEAPAATLKPTAVLDAVSAMARELGVRPGQTIAEACVLVSSLQVEQVRRDAVLQSLGRVCEVALQFGFTAALEAPDTVWLDITGAAHLAGGEEALALELASRVRELGHSVRIAVASGPHVARAFARWMPPHLGLDPQVQVVSAEATARELAALPVQALPLDAETVAWFARLGVLTIGELSALPRSAVAPRLGPEAARVLDLCAGRDAAPLQAYTPPPVLVESLSWEDAVAGLEPLRFVLRGLLARLSARLRARGSAAGRLELVVTHDAAIARHAGAPATTRLTFELAQPLWRPKDLERVLLSRLERTELQSPAVALSLIVPLVTPAEGRQLQFAELVAGITTTEGAHQLPVLLAELAADVGVDHFGTLELVDSHRPEQHGRLKPAVLDDRSARASKKRRRARPPPAPLPSPAGTLAAAVATAAAPTRLLHPPVPLRTGLRPGATLVIEDRLFSIERLRFERRLEAVEWWRHSAVARDYVRLWLRDADGVLEALAYVDRETGKRYLQGIWD